MSVRKRWVVSNGKKEMEEREREREGAEKRQTGPREHSTKQRFQTHTAVSFFHHYLVGRYSHA